MDAFTRFDRLAAQFARESGGRLNDRKKAMLDAALDMHAQAAAKLRLQAGAATPTFEAA